MPRGIFGKYFFRISIFGLLILFLLPWPAVWAAENKPLLVIFHTSDIHGKVLEKRGSEGRLTNIGFARLKGYVNSYPAPAKLLLDAGDILYGLPLATTGRKQLMAQLLQAMNYDALAVGNRDFECDFPRLIELYDTYQLNFMSANILEKEEGIPLFPPYKVQNFGDFKVGIFGLTAPGVTLHAPCVKVTTLDTGLPDSLIETANQMVKMLKKKEKVDLVIALTHLGTTNESDSTPQVIAEKVLGIDLIIDGYNTYPVTGLKVGSTFITSAGQFLENMGQVIVNRRNGGFALDLSTLPAGDFENVRPNLQIATILANLSATTQKELNQVVGTSPVTLEIDLRQSLSTSFGRVIAASMAKASQAQVAMLNNGIIRASLSAGDITQGQLLEALPLNSQILKIQLTGSEIIQILRQSLLNTSQKYLQFYGLSATISETDKIQPDGSTIRQAQIEAMDVDGRPLELDTEYTVAINDFLYSGGDGYTIFSNRPTEIFSNLNDAFLNFLNTTPTKKIKNIAHESIMTIIREEPKIIN